MYSVFFIFIACHIACQPRATPIYRVPDRFCGAPMIKTDAELAQILGVNVRRISKWRKAGAPDNKMLRLWRAWLSRTGRGTIGARISDDAINAQNAALGLSGLDLGHNHPQAPQTAPAGQQPAPATPADALAFGSIATPTASTVSVISSDPSAGVTDWRNEHSRERALLARRERETLEGQLIPTDQVLALAQRLGTAIASVLRDDVVWQEIRLELDAAAPDHLRRLRQRHDHGLALLRDRTAGAIKSALATLGPNPQSRN
jgi:hypothetical protein